MLLTRGARSVQAVDVGRGQLHPKLTREPRLTLHEATDARRLGEVIGPASIDLATLDVSFISLTAVLTPALLEVMRRGAHLVALIKPQFEVGPGGLGKGGIVRDERLRTEAVARVLDGFAPLGLTLLGSMPSPIAGGDGNREVLAAARHG